jgi:hypothetical protein
MADLVWWTSRNFVATLTILALTNRNSLIETLASHGFEW